MKSDDRVVFLRGDLAGRHGTIVARHRTRLVNWDWYLTISTIIDAHYVEVYNVREDQVKLVRP